MERPRRDGHVSAAARACFSNTYAKPARVIGAPSALTKSSGTRTDPRRVSHARRSAAVSFQSGRHRSLRPFPRTRRLGGRCRDRFAIMAPTSSETRSPAAKQRCIIARSRTPRRVVRSGAFRIARTFRHDQVKDKLLIVALDGDGVDLTDLLQSRRHLVFDVAHERLDRGKAQIAGGDTIATLALDVTKKVQDQRRVQLFDKKLRRSCPDALSREGKQEPEAVGISFAAMRAIAPLSGHVVAQEAGDQRSKEGHMGSPMINVSAAAAMSVISSGVACRYQ